MPPPVVVAVGRCQVRRCRFSGRGPGDLRRCQVRHEVQPESIARATAGPVLFMGCRFFWVIATRSAAGLLEGEPGAGPWFVSAVVIFTG
jgi:hypothetical protein